MMTEKKIFRKATNANKKKKQNNTHTIKMIYIKEEKNKNKREETSRKTLLTQWKGKTEEQQIKMVMSNVFKCK